MIHHGDDAGEDYMAMENDLELSVATRNENNDKNSLLKLGSGSTSGSGAPMGMGMDPESSLFTPNLKESPILRELSSWAFLTGWASGKDYSLRSLWVWRFVVVLDIIGVAVFWARAFFYGNDELYDFQRNKSSVLITPVFFFTVMLGTSTSILQNYLTLYRYPMFESLSRLIAKVYEENVDIDTQIPLKLRDIIQSAKKVVYFLAIPNALFIFIFVLFFVPKDLQVVAYFQPVYLVQLTCYYLFLHIFVSVCKSSIKQMIRIANSLNEDNISIDNIHQLTIKYSLVFEFLNIWCPRFTISLINFACFLINLVFTIFSASDQITVIWTLGSALFFLLLVPIPISQVSSAASEFQRSVHSLIHRISGDRSRARGKLILASKGDSVGSGKDSNSRTKIRRELMQFFNHVSLTSDHFGWVHGSFRFQTKHIWQAMLTLYSFSTVYLFVISTTKNGVSV